MINGLVASVKQLKCKEDILDHHNYIVGTDYLEKGILFDVAFSGYGDGYILEIGTDLGQSLLALASGSKLANREKVFSIDVDMGRTDNFWCRDGRRESGGNRWRLVVENLVLAGVNDWIYLIGADSLEAWRFLDIKLRVLFIDGSHDDVHKENDIIQYGNMLVSGGVIFVHDYWEKDPNREPGTYYTVNRLIRDSSIYTNFKVAGIMAYATKR